MIKVVAHKAEKQKLKLSEALMLTLPFLGLILAYGYVTGKIGFGQWPPKIEMLSGFWLPVVFCGIVYFFLVVNLYARRIGEWKWYREGLISAVILVLIWWIILPEFERSIASIERHKVGIHY